MFETAELGRSVSKSEYKEQEPDLRESLLIAQDELLSAGFPVIVLFGGVDGAGKGETANLMTEWMDPHWIDTRAFDEPSEEERERPEFWRFWRALPANGRMGVFLSAWYSRPILERANGGEDDDFEKALDEILAFERTLTDDGAVIVKFWMHLGQKEQRKRFKSLERDPLQAWRITEKDWNHWRMYEEFATAAQTMITRTSTGNAPWHIVEGVDRRYRSLQVGTLLLDAMQDGIREAQRKAARPAPAPTGFSDAERDHNGEQDAPSRPTTILSRLDLTQQLTKSDYRELLEVYQGRLNAVHREARDKKISTIVVFEGWDAAGKGGAIRRLTPALDARSVQVIPVSAPTDEEKAHHYLWRFWRHLPRAGRVTIFDRSWYGRVLVERVEAFARDEEWQRAFAEINLFEQELVDSGTVLVKFWLHVSPEEQMRRFEERRTVSYKSWKLTADDWRNRERWSEYALAAHEMVERTSPQSAPWTLVEGDQKRFARIKVLRTVCEAMQKRVDESSRSAGANTSGESPPEP